ncbi:MAG: hypothetical protein ACKO3S_00830 [bacterium]
MKSLVLVVLFALVTASGAVAQSTPVSDKPFFEAREDVTTYAHVLAVDRKTRTVTLWTEEEEDTVSVQVSKDVKTLGKVKAGDVVRITYTDMISVRVDTTGQAGVTHEVARADAKKGQTPSLQMSESLTLRASIVAVDRAAGTFTLRDGEGDEDTLRPMFPENLDRIAVGDVVVFTISQSMAAVVEQAPGRKVTMKRTVSPQ